MRKQPGTCTLVLGTRQSHRGPFKESFLKRQGGRERGFQRRGGWGVQVREQTPWSCRIGEKEAFKVRLDLMEVEEGGLVQHCGARS
jgi:hypothetical protein